MVEIYVFGYTYKDKEFVPPHIKKGVVSPPPVKERWGGNEDNKLFSIIVYNKGGAKKAINITIEFSPSIIKGWKIFDFGKVRIIDGGMINDRVVQLHIEKIEKSERLRIDFLVKTHSLKSLNANCQEKKIEKVFLYVD